MEATLLQSQNEWPIESKRIVLPFHFFFFVFFCFWHIIDYRKEAPRIMRKVLITVKDYNGSDKRCNLYLTKKLYFAENGQEFIEQEK